MKRPKNIQGDQLVNATRHEVFAKLLPEAPHQKGWGCSRVGHRCHTLCEGEAPNDAGLNLVTLSRSER